MRAPSVMIQFLTPCMLIQVTSKNVGLPNSIKVWHDNSGRHPAWFLEYIRIRKRESFDKIARKGGKGSGTRVVPPGKTGGGTPWAVFPCGRWFSTELDDCRISRTLFVGHSTPLIQYKVRTTCGSHPGWPAAEPVPNHDKPGSPSHPPPPHLTG